MKRNLIVSLALLCCMLCFSCKKNSAKNQTSISYGTSFGMCVDYCSRQMVIVGQQVAYSKSKNGANPDTKSCAKTISNDEANVFVALLEQSKIKTLPEVIGCPDCADGGAEWVELTTNGKTYKVVFDYNKAPNELQDVVAKLRALSATFNGCN